MHTVSIASTDYQSDRDYFAYEISVNDVVIAHLSFEFPESADMSNLSRIECAFVPEVEPILPVANSTVLAAHALIAIFDAMTPDYDLPIYDEPVTFQL